jgi:hypothetical protein
MNSEDPENDDEPNTESKEIETPQNSTTVVKKLKVESSEILDCINKANDILAFLIQKHPDSVQEFYPIMKEINEHYSNYYMNEFDVMKSLTYNVQTLEYHILAFGEANKETINLGVQTASKMLQLKKFNECIDLAKRMIYIVAKSDLEIDEQTYNLAYITYSAAMGNGQLDVALDYLHKCLKIKNEEYQKFLENVEKKLNFHDIVEADEKVSEQQLNQNINEGNSQYFVGKLESILSDKIKEVGKSKEEFTQMYEQINEFKAKEEEKAKRRQDLKLAKQLNVDINEGNQIEVIKKSVNPQEAFLNIKSQKQFHLAYLNEQMCELYILKKQYKSAYHYCSDSLTWFEELNVTRLHRAYSNMALIHFNNSQYIKCIENAKRALLSETYDMDDLTINNGDLYVLIANSYEKLAIIDKALKYQEKAVKFCETVFGQSSRKFGGLCDKLGYFYKSVGNNKLSKESYYNALCSYISFEINKNIKKKICLVMFELGCFEFDLENYSESLFYYDSLMNFAYDIDFQLPRYMTQTILSRKELLFKKLKDKPEELKQIFPEIQFLIDKFKEKDEIVNKILLEREGLPDRTENN